jgi:hypothetical protein
MMGDPGEMLSRLMGEEDQTASQGEQQIDLEKLAEKIVEMLLRELSIENERMGYG